MNGWKIFAILLLVLLIAENIMLMWGYSMVIEEEKNTNSCYYDFCSGSVDAYFDTSTKVCSCYDEDYMGELTISKSKWYG